MHRSLFNCKVEMGKTFQTRRGAWGKPAETPGGTTTLQEFGSESKGGRYRPIVSASAPSMHRSVA